jgi:hypothetical protein
MSPLQKKKKALLSFLGVFFKAHPMAQIETNVLNKLIEQFQKTLNVGFGQNIKNLHIKVSQKSFMGCFGSREIF